MNNRVSVIITTCRGSSKLIRAIESVLRQSYKNSEIVVVDDNGEGTAEQLFTEKMLNKYLSLDNFKYIKHKVNSNGATARNTGVANAYGEYIAFLDDDDFFLKSRIEKIVQAFEDNGDYDAAYSSVLFLRNSNVENSYIVTKEGNLQKKLLIDQSLLGTGSNIVVRKVAFDSINGFDETFKRYQDVEFMIRLLEHHRMLKVSEYLVVKDIGDSRFYPKFESFVEAQEHYLDTFGYLIDKLNENESRKCILPKRRELVFSAYASKNSQNIKVAYKKLFKSVPDVSKTELLKMKLRGNYIRYDNKFFQALREKKRAKRTNEINEKLPVNIGKEIEIMVSGNYECDCN